jgi:hypothetical protein
VSNFPRADDNIHTIRLTRTDDCIHSIQRPSQRRNVDATGRSGGISFFPDCKRRGQGRTREWRRRRCYFTRGRQSENVDAQDVVLKELHDRVHLRGIVVHSGKRGIGGRKAVGVDLPVQVSGIVRRHQRHVTVCAG